MADRSDHRRPLTRTIDLTMKSSVTQLMLSVGLWLVHLQGTSCQVLSFDRGFQRDNVAGNWTAAGRVKLTNQDMIIFEPLVTVQAVSELCSINLKSCISNGQTPPTSQACYCTGVSDEEFDLYVSSEGDIPSKDHTVIATVPSRYMFNPLSLSVEIRDIPGFGQQGDTLGVCSELTKSLTTMAKKLDAANETNRQLTSLNTQQTSQIVQLMSQNSELLSQLSKKDEEMAARLKKTDETISQLQALTSQLVTQNSQLSTDIRQLTTENNKLLTQISQKDDAIMNQTSPIVNVMAKLSNNSGRIDEIFGAVMPTSCADYHTWDPRPVVSLAYGIKVVCDTITDNGGWIIFQRRLSGAVNFYRGWMEYKNGFGDMPSNFWLGLESLHRLTTKGNWELRVDMMFNGTYFYAHYSHFKLWGKEENYKLEVSGYKGNAGDSLGPQHTGMPFSTKDRDSDQASSGSCAQKYGGAWWYKNCHDSNLNGEWGSTAKGKGLVWTKLTGSYHSVDISEMKIRRRP